jgi:hypothetical protein
MLRPDERAHLLELLRPPSGCQLDCAVGTTFSLDLISALMLPLSFAFFDWEDTDGKITANPLALLEALRRYGNRFTVFCQSGQIRLPQNYQPLVTFLEPCIYDVEPPDPEGVFHPKVWALRFLQDGAVRYRVLCLSRNLTFDKCWDTVVALDGELLNRSNAIAANHPLADFLSALPTLASRSLPRERRQDIAKVADELKRVRFTWPEGFDESKCRFWVGGLNSRAVKPFGARRDNALIVSPFLSTGVVRDFLDRSGETHLVSRPESLQDVPTEILQECETIHVLATEVGEEEADDNAPIVGREEVLDGLHAKLFVVDHGWDSSVFTGSFNATGHALEHNVEFMVELVGKRSRFGVDQFLRQVKGETNFSDLLQPYDVNAPSAPTDAAARQLDELFQATKRALSAARPWLEVTAAPEAESFNLTLQWKLAPRWPKQKFEIRAWPITQHMGRALPLDKSVVFPRLSYAGLTPLIAFSITAQIGEAKGDSVFVMNLPLHGAPADRQDRVLRSLIENRDQLLRYILFLLAAGDEAATFAGDLQQLLRSGEDGAQGNMPTPYLLETMLRALHREPAQLERVASLLDVLKKAPGSSELLSDEFQQVWEPIWDVARQTETT